MEHARTSKDANGLVKSVSSLYQVCVKYVSRLCQRPTKAVSTPYQGRINSLSTPYCGRINSLLSYNFFRHVAAVMALLVMMLAPHAVNAQVATIPYSCDFENGTENGRWVVNNPNSYVNHWVIGTATYSSLDKSLYVSRNGTANEYSRTKASYVYAYRQINFATAGEYSISFKWKARGEVGCWDAMYAALCPPGTACPPSTDITGNTNSLPTNYINVADVSQSYSTTGAFLWTNADSDWKTSIKSVNITTTGNYYLVFYWKNDDGGGDNPPAAVDDISITIITCPKPTLLTNTAITTNSATVDWTENGTASSWILEYSTSSTFPAGSTTSVNVTSKPYTITGLTTETTYYVRVKANCGGGDVSDWSNTCEVLPSACKRAGSGTNQSNYLPSYSYYNYSLSEQIYTPAEVGSAGALTAIQFYNGGETKTRTFDIYIVHTTKTAFTSTDDWIHPTAADLVYSGSVTMTAGQWTEITLTSPFNYDGTSNLAIIVDDNTGDYTSSPHMACYTYTTTQCQALHNYSDSEDFNPNSVTTNGTQVYFKNQIKFCIESSSCPTSYSVPQCFDFNDYASATTSESTDSGLPDCFESDYSGTAPGYAPHIIYNNTTYTCATGADSKGLIICASANASYGSPTIVTIPEVSGIVANCVITFDYKNSTTTRGTFALGYMSGGAWTLLEDNISLTTSCTSHRYVVTSNLPSGARLAFRLTNTANSPVYVFIDNICINECTSRTLAINDMPAGNAMLVGNSTTLTATPTDGIGHGNVSWSSSNGSVVSVNASTGVITAEADGTATITATISAADGYCEATVTSATITVSETACPKPTNVTVSDINENSATVSWIGSGSASSYTVRYRKTGFSEGFENGIPLTWTTIDNDGDGYDWYGHINTGLYNYSTHSGDGVAASESFDNNGSVVLTPDNWLITPQVDLGGTVSFWYANQSTYPENLRVYVSTTGTAIANFTSISEDITTNSDYQQFTYDLSTYAGHQGYIAIRHYNVSDQFILLIDDFDISSAGEWTELTTTSTSINLTNLDMETDYEVQVRADCDEDGLSGWTSSEDFTTLLPTPCPILSADFETTTEGNSGWQFENGDRSSKWYRGTNPDNGGSYSIYITTNNNGNNHNYSNQNTIVYAYKSISLAGGTYRFSYNCMSNGEVNFDFLRVALVPGDVTLTGGGNGFVPSGFSSTSLPTGWISLDGKNQLYGFDSWKSIKSIQNIPAGNYKLVFIWRSNNQDKYNPPAAIDNVEIVKLNPPTPTIDGTTPVCHGSPTSLSTSTFTTYEWSNSAGNTQTVTPTPSTTTSYTVTVTDGDGCEATSSPFTVTVNRIDATIQISNP